MNGKDAIIARQQELIQQQIEQTQLLAEQNQLLIEQVAVFQKIVEELRDQISRLENF